MPVVIVFLVLWAALGKPEQPASRWVTLWRSLRLLLGLFRTRKEES